MTTGQSSIPHSSPAVQPGRPHLPQPLTPLVGREAEVGAVIELLQRPEVRLVTLTGPGGVGKTRVAIEVACRIDRNVDRETAFVNLGPVDEPDLVVPAIARALGVRESSDQRPIDTVISALRRPMLIVLDNFEQVLDAAGEVVELLSACPDLSVLVTSRVVLHVTGEHEYPLSPLAIPSAERVPVEELAKSEAVALFVQRAKAVRPDFDLTPDNVRNVAEICGRLDGLPLAIELAAARIKLLQPHGLLVRLSPALPLLSGGARDLPARQQTLRDTIAWSYDLLQPGDQRLFRQLSIFVDGFTLDAAESVAESIDDAFAGLTTLADNNLIRAATGSGDDNRFYLLETVREFGLEQLRAAGEEDDVRLSHARWITTLVERAEVESTDRAAMRLEQDWENVRSALNWLYERGDRLAVGRIVAALAQYFYMRGKVRDARLWGERVRDWDDLPDVIYGRCLWPVIYSTGASGKLDEAWALTVETERYLRRAADEQLLARMLYFKGVTAMESGHLDEGHEPLDECIGLLRKLGDRHWLPLALEAKGLLSYLSGEIDTANELFHQSLDMMDEDYHGWSKAGPLTNLARIARDREQYDEALDYYRQALQLRSSFGDRIALISIIRAVGELARRASAYKSATMLYAAATAQREATGLAIRPTNRHAHDDALEHLRCELGDQEFDRHWQTGYGLTLDAALERIQSLSLQPEDRATATVAGTTELLSARESEILELMTRGLTTAEIAGRLYISPRTVSTHQSNIYGKLGVSNQGAAIAYAYQHGLVQPAGNEDEG